MRFPARIGRGLVVVAGAFMMLWPAIFNGYPLLYPDSMSYLGDGRPLARILFLRAPHNYLAMRSEIYSLGIFFFHWNVTPWPVIILQALLTSYILWLVVRSLTARSLATQSPNAQPLDTRRTALAFLILDALVSLTTGLAWYV
jgi:hypothetical protein